MNYMILNVFLQYYLFNVVILFILYKIYKSKFLFVQGIKMKVINLFGAPSAGKSTTMLGLTYKMKLLKYNVENTPEFFKELIYEEGKVELFGGQLMVLAEQNKRLARLMNKADFVVTDCPLPLITYYTDSKYIKDFKEFSLNLFNSYENENFLIVRNHDFEKEKRNHNADQASIIERELPEFLDKNNIKFKTFKTNDELVEQLINSMIEDGVIHKPILNKAQPAYLNKREPKI